MFDVLFSQSGDAIGLPVKLGLPIVLGAIGYLLAVASPLRRKSAPAAVCLVAAAATAWYFWWNFDQPPVEKILFVVFAGLMVLSGCGMQVEANPVYAALWFALVILSTCGLFLMQGAAFISAATIIVYAGAIIVTFLFVIMLARQTGESIYDKRFRNPLLSISLGSVLLAVLMYAFQQPPPTVSEPSPLGRGQGEGAFLTGDSPSPQPSPEGRGSVSNPRLVTASAPTPADADTLAVLGRSLFVDHLWSVEIAGVLLLVATFGTILIALDTREDRA